jgi:hypothetical protein
MTNATVFSWRSLHEQLTTRRAEKALSAIYARVHGVLDHPYVVACGPMSEDMVSDIVKIMEHYEVTP